MSNEGKEAQQRADAEALAADIRNRTDSILQAAMMTRAGAQFQATQLGMSADGVRLQKQGYATLSYWYENDGVFSAVIDRAAEDALAAGFDFHTQADPAFKEEFERLELDEVFTDALRFARLHGAALLVPIFVGNASLAQPLYRSRRKEIDRVEVISIDRLTVDVYGPDGYPLIYNVEALVNNGNNSGSFKLHHSRCIVVNSRARPYKQTDAELIWPGISEGQRCLAVALRLSRSFQWAEKALERKSQAVFKMKGLAAAIQAKLNDVITTRLNMVDAVRSILNCVAIDEGDEFDVTDTNLASISDTLDSQMQAMAAVSGYPITVLFGRRTTSLNSKGDSDTDTYYRMLNKIRRNMLRNPLKELVAMINEYTPHNVPKSEVAVAIAKLDALSEYEEAEIAQMQAKAFKDRADAVATLRPQQQSQTTSAPAGKTSNNTTTPAPAKAQELITAEEARKLLFNEEEENAN